MVQESIAVEAVPAKEPQQVKLPSFPQGSVKPLQPVDGPSAWTAKDYEGRSDYITLLNETHVAELEAAVERVLAKEVVTVVDNKYLDFSNHVATQEDFPLPTLGPQLTAIRDEVQNGRGFALIRGVPVWKWTRVQTLVAYWGIGLYWGKARSNNAKRHIIGHVKDAGVDPEHKNKLNRIYLTRVAQPWHCDSVDMVGLLCLKPAKEGGMSSWSSSVSVHNQLLKQDPEIVRLLADEDAWYNDRKNEVPEGKLPHYKLPIFNYHKGRLLTHFNDSFYQLASRWPGVPPLSPTQEAALEAFRKAAGSDPLRLDYWLEPGDLQLLNNHTVVHTRTGWVDYEELDKKRHLLRLWIAPPEGVAWEVPEAYAEIYGSTEPGKRGGIIVPGALKDVISLEAE